MPASRPVPSPPATLSLTRPLRDTFALYSADDPGSAWIRAQHLASVIRLTPFLMAANVFNAGIVIITVGHLSPKLLACWVAGISAVVVLALRGYVRSRGRTISTASRRAFRRSTVHALALGALWGLVPLLWFPVVPPASQLVIASIARACCRLARSRSGRCRRRALPT